MKLNATVLDTHSASQYDDKTRRVTLRVEEADCMNTRLTVRSDELQEDDQLFLLVLTQKQASQIVQGVDILLPDGIPQGFTLAQIIDQLRPDAPPPFMEQADAKVIVHCDSAIGGCGKRHESPLCVKPMSPDTAETQEFRLGGTA